MPGLCADKKNKHTFYFLSSPKKFLLKSSWFVTNFSRLENKKASLALIEVGVFGE